MAEPYISEIKLFPFAWPPRSWALCDGTELPVTQNQALYALIRNYYGGSGASTFKLPDLRGRVPVHRGDDWPLGVDYGVEAVALSEQELPRHYHEIKANSGPGQSAEFTGMVPSAAINAADDAPVAIYSTAGQGNTALLNASVTDAGEGKPHSNLQPSLVMSFCIAITGIYPPRT